MLLFTQAENIYNDEEPDTPASELEPPTSQWVANLSNDMWCLPECIIRVWGGWNNNINISICDVFVFNTTIVDFPCGNYYFLSQLANKSRCRNKNKGNIWVCPPSSVHDHVLCSHKAIKLRSFTPDMIVMGLLTLQYPALPHCQYHRFIYKISWQILFKVIFVNTFTA